MTKKEKIEELNQKLEALHERKKKVEKQLSDYYETVSKYIDITKAKKSGNALFVVAAIVALIGVVLVIANPDNILGFSLLAGFYVCVLLILAIIKKVRGMKIVRKLRLELIGIDIEKVFEEERGANRERDSINAEIYEIESKRANLLRYHGKDWRLTEINPKDSATLIALEQDLRDVLDAIMCSNDDAFLTNNWLINNIMLYYTATLKEDTRTLDRYSTVLNLLGQDTPWVLRTLKMLVIGGCLRLMGKVFGEPYDEWDQLRQSAGLSVPDDLDDMVFYGWAVNATDKTMDKVAKLLRDARTR